MRSHKINRKQRSCCDPYGADEQVSAEYQGRVLTRSWNDGEFTQYLLLDSLSDAMQPNLATPLSPVAENAPLDVVSHLEEEEEEEEEKEEEELNPLPLSMAASIWSTGWRRQD